jgi:hypothetical protein
VRELDEGHKYALRQIGSDEEQVLTFLKRNGGPVQRDEEYPGTLTQEVIRALIARTKYLDALLPCRENVYALAGLRQALYWYEVRAFQRHEQGLNRVNAAHADGEFPIPFEMHHIEDLPVRADDLHIDADGVRRLAL